MGKSSGYVRRDNMIAIGDRFGRLVVISESGCHIKPSGQKLKKWLCLCDCGNKHVVIGNKLKGGLTKSCGCFRKEVMSQGPNRSHGMNKTPAYEIWCGMIKRCFNKKSNNYDIYGGRGISVCDEWLKFENFYRDIGDRPGNASIDRIDNNGNYEPSNCRWATSKEQARNTRSNRIIEFKGESKCLSEWSELFGVKVATLWNRINQGWDIEKALITPTRKFTTCKY